MTSVVRSRSAPILTLGRPRWYSHGWNHPAVYRLSAVLAGTLPRPACLALASALASVAYARLGAERRSVIANLERVVPELSADRRVAVAREVFRSFAICFADLLSTNRGARCERLLADVRGAEHLDTVFAGGDGAIVATAHLGNWELGGRLLALRAARPTHVVMAEEADSRVERLLRAGPGPVRFVTRGRPTASIELLAALRRGEVVAVQGDRALGDRSDLVASFFGRPAVFPVGPVVLARAAGAPLVPAFCFLAPDRRYTIEIGAPIRVARGGEGAALHEWVGVLEAAVRRHPEQWFNFFDLWSHAPAR